MERETGIEPATLGLEVLSVAICTRLPGSEAGARPDRRHEIRNPRDHQAEVCPWSVCPRVPEPLSADAADIDAIEGAGDGIEAGRVDDQVELVLGLAGLDPGRRDALDRRLVDVDEV